MPLSETEYALVPNIPMLLLHPEKKLFSVDDALRDALQTTTQVKGHSSIFDIVCLRLRTYMWDDDLLLHENFAEVQKRLEAIHAEKVV